MKYNVWHIELYHGWYDCDGPSDCNLKGDYIFDARFTKDDVMGLFAQKYSESRVFEVWKCEKIKENQELYLADL